MLLLYNLILLLSLLLLSPFFIFKLIYDKRYRLGLSERLGFIPNAILNSLKGDMPIWFHAASVGEVMASIRLLEGFRERWPNKKLLVSTITPTGNKAAREKLKADAIIFLPLDIPWIVNRVLKALNPSILILMETEIWPTLIKKVGNMGIPIVLVNGRISDRSYGKYRFISPLLKKVFDDIKLFFMQSEGDAQRIITLGAEPSKVFMTGNIKFDTRTTDRDIGFMKEWGGPVLVAGSTRKGEDSPLLDIYKELRNNYSALKLILAPRHLERVNEVEGILKEKGLQYARRSEVSDRPAQPIILLDTLGELNSFYKHASVVFVGGSLVPVGGHNLLEPAAYGRPVLFGPHIENFRDIANILVECGGGIKVEDFGELKAWVGRLLSDEYLCNSMGDKARQAVLKNKGATERILNTISDILKATPSS